MKNKFSGYVKKYKAKKRKEFRDDIIETFKQMEKLGHGCVCVKNGELAFEFNDRTHDYVRETKEKYGTDEAILLVRKFLTSPVSEQD